EVPLDPEGGVAFPGSAEVWMVAKGQASIAGAAGRLKKLSKAVVPDDEDKILLRMAHTRHKNVSELDSFLAVARIDSHRPEKLDEASPSVPI
ncbi:MAG TPA: hypothetical protein VGN17_13365, partial [Bryobacteraceae bacterium]